MKKNGSVGLPRRHQDGTAHSVFYRLVSSQDESSRKRLTGSPTGSEKFLYRSQLGVDHVGEFYSFERVSKPEQSLGCSVGTEYRSVRVNSDQRLGQRLYEDSSVHKIGR